MAVNEIRFVPNRLPPATLFLDDIEAIEELLRPPPGSKYSNFKTQFRFRTLVADTVSDLENVGGKHTNFAIVTGLGYFSVVGFATFWDAPNCSPEQRWSIYGRILAIIAARRPWWRHLIPSSPPPLWAMLVVVILLMATIAELVARAPSVPHDKRLGLFLALLAPCLAVGLLLGRYVQQPYVVFRFLQHRHRSLWEIVKPVAIPVLTAVLGAIAGAVSTIGVQRWLR